MDLSKRIIKSISIGIYQGLYESKSISHRTIDRKLWLSVASVISKNRSTEAEFIKPMKKLTKDDLLNRYVAALLITKKPCPKSEKDIETNKTLKLFAQKALQLGATLEDIQNLYDVNSGIKSQSNTSKSQSVKQGFNPALIDGPKETALQKLGKQQHQEYVDTLVNKELEGKYLYKYITTPGWGYSENGLSVGKRDLEDNESRFVLGTYLMSNEKFDIFVSDYKKIFTVWSTNSWKRETASKIMLGEPGIDMKFVPKMHESQEDAMDDHNGMENTAVCTQFNSYTLFPEFFKFDKVVYQSSTWNDSFLTTRNAYIPALGELMDAFSISNLLDDVKGFVWSSTFKDPTHIYAYDGKTIKVMDIETDSAYIVPFIPINKGETIIDYEPEQKYYPGILNLNKSDYIKQDKNTYLKLAKAWNMSIIESEYEAIERQVRNMSDNSLKMQIIELLKKGAGNNNRNDEKGLYKSGIYDNRWNMVINGLVYYKNKLYAVYWTGGDSTDSSDWINIDNLIGTHTDTTAKTRFSFDAKAKHEILVTGYTLLMYWDKQIKKYQ